MHLASPRKPPSGRMDSVAPYDTSFAPNYKLKIVGGKPVYVLEDSKTPRVPLPENAALTAQVEKTSAQKPRSPPVVTPPRKEQNVDTRNTWASHSVLPPISPRVYNSAAPEFNKPQTNTDPGYSSAGSDLEHAGPRAETQFSRTQEMDLLHHISGSLAAVNMECLKNVYNDITRYDSNLTGVASNTDFMTSLHKCQIFLSQSDFNQLVAAHSSGNNRVNYEKALSFIASAIKLRNSPPDVPKFYEAPNQVQGEPGNMNLDFMSIDLRPSRPEHERSGAQGKLMQLIETQILSGDRPLDLEQLRNQFNIADRLHRGSLSHGEIKKICYENRVPIQESVINHILDRCRTTGDGQYRWTDFMDFLEKVQPAGTGLNFTSKQPADFVKKLPEPRDSWPKADFNSQAEPPSTHRHSKTAPLPSLNTQPAGSAASGERKSTAETRAQLDNTQQQTSGGDDPWFERYTKLAEALYKNDLQRTGRIPASECTWLVGEYNNIYRLNMPKPFTDDCIQKHTVAGQTDITSLLNDLMKSESA